MPHTWFPSNGVSRRLFIAALAALLAFTTLAIVPGSVPAARSADHTGDVPPGFPEACGLDFLVILDESGSIRTAGAIGDITGAFDTLVTSLMGTGSRIYTMDFNSNANPWGSGWVDTVPANQGIFDSYISGYDPPGAPAYWTNWEDAFRVAHHSGAAATADVVLFITDGNPTATVDRSAADATEYGTDWPLSVPGDVNIDVANSAAYEAANVDPHPDGGSAVAQRVKGESYVWGIGVGDVVGDAAAQARLAAVSDASTLVDFDDLGDVLRQAVFSNCQNSLRLNKTVMPPEGQAITGVGYDFDVAVTVNDGAAVVTPTSDTTNDSGDAGPYVWSTEAEDDVAVITVTESGVGDTGAILTGASCTWQTPGSSGNATVSFTAGDDFFVITDVPANTLVNCDVENEVPAGPALSIVKTSTSHPDGDDDGLADAPIGGPTTIDYTITTTNTGNVTLTDVTVTDPLLGTLNCDWGNNPDETLGVGDSVTCTGSYVVDQAAIESGANIDNTATAASITEELSVTDTYTVTIDQEPRINIEKSTNGQNADEAPGPSIAVGSTVTWMYVVTNAGNVTLANVTVTDDTLGDICTIGDLAAGAQDTCTTTGIASAGQYVNIGKVTGDYPRGEVQVSDSDLSHYFGTTSPPVQTPGIDIVKSTNGQDANTIPGPSITVGTQVTWTYVVSNTGQVDLTGIIVTDDMGVVPIYQSGDTGEDQILGVGEVWIYEVTGTAATGQYANVGTVADNNGIDPTVTATDLSHYFGQEILASATIGDTVWNDENENGVQDNGEKGISGATVRLTLPDATTVQAITNANGLYLFSALEAGQYEVELILSSIPDPSEGSLKLTTAGSFTIQLADGESYLDADFGVVAALPKTGISADNLALIALALLLAGGVAVLTTRKRKDGTGDGDIAA